VDFKAKNLGVYLIGCLALKCWLLIWFSTFTYKWSLVLLEFVLDNLNGLASVILLLILDIEVFYAVITLYFLELRP